MAIKAPNLGEAIAGGLKSLAVRLTEFFASLEAEVNKATPPGVVVAWLGATAPSGWIALDGATYDVDKFPELARVLGAVGPSFSVPLAIVPTPSGGGIWIIKV